MFDKANRLMQAVVPKLGVSDDSFIVAAGHGNTFHVVTPGKVDRSNVMKTVPTVL
jgi:hypothetical protein